MLSIDILIFILLSPGLLLTIPPGSKGLWMSRETSITAIVVHALLFGACLYIVRTYVMPKRVEAFQGSGLSSKQQSAAEASEQRRAKVKQAKTTAILTQVTSVLSQVTGGTGSSGT